MTLLALLACASGGGSVVASGEGDGGAGGDSGREETGGADTGPGGGGGADSGAGDSGGAGADSGDTGTASPAWTPGDLSVLPDASELLPLPGGASGLPAFTSNNPETFTSTGFLYEVARADDARGGDSHPLDGDWSVYLHHLNDTGRAVTLQLLVTNPGAADLTVSARGSGYTQSDYALSRGSGPDYHVALDTLTGAAASTFPATTVTPAHAVTVWSKVVPDGQEVDARLWVTTSAPAFVYLVAADSADPNDAVALSRTAATGTIASPGDPPPPYGREAGVYAADTWAARWSVPVGEPGTRLGYMVNTATGTGWAQVQAFPALTRFADSSAESVGMYGDLYDLTIDLAPGEGQAAPRTVEVWMAAYGGGSPSFYWNGPVEVDGAVQAVWLTPDARLQRLAVTTVAPDAPTTVRLRLPIPGLSSIPQAIWLRVAGG